MERPSDEEIELLLHPDVSDVIVSKAIIMRSLCQATVAELQGLLDAVRSQTGSTAPPGSGDPGWQEQARHYKWEAAARMGLAELQGEALALPMGPLNAQETLLIRGVVSTGPSSSKSWNHSCEHYSVGLAQRYRASSRAWSFDRGGFVLQDADLYLQRIDASDMHVRVAVTLKQAVACYRAELYLGAAVLLGSASEGAWIQLAKQLRSSLGNDARTLGTDLDQEPPRVAEIQRRASQLIASRCIEALKRTRIGRGRWEEIVQAAISYRRFRNYAIHFQEEEIEQLNYATVGLLLLNATPYFNDLYRLRAEFPD